MAFTRPTGKHRKPSRLRRGGANAAGVASLAAVGVVGSLASPALASSPEPGAQEASAERSDLSDTGLGEAVGTGDSLAVTIDGQAQSQEFAAERAKAEEAAAKKAAAEAKKKADEAKRKAAAEKAKKERAAKERAAKERAAKERAQRSASAERSSVGGYVLPVDAPLSTGYQQGGGMWSSGSHTGVDFSAGANTSVKSVAAGEVVEAGDGGSYGNNVVIKHEDGKYTQYGHLNSVSVSVGQSVSGGDQIGLSGSTGNSSGPHLHFEVRNGPDYGSDIDPVAYLRDHGLKL